MLNVFCDFHHASLLYSLILLFEKRLGGKVYRPIGIDWYTLGFWKVYNHPATVEQFLGIGGNTPDGTDSLNDVVQDLGQGVYHCQDIDSGLYNRAITLPAFMANKFDVIIASMPCHVEPFKRLADMHPNKPKLIYQIGNAWDVPVDMPIKNIMASSKLNYHLPGFNIIEYHQEFDTDIFKPFFPEVFTYPKRNIYSFVNVFDKQPHFYNDWQLFTQVEKIMTEYSFKSYGGQCRDGAAHGSEQLARKMREAMFIWHTKWGGDGYGHIIHNAAASGVPMIIKADYYKRKMGEALIRDGQTCLTIDGLDAKSIADKIRYYEEPNRYRDLCHGAYDNFKKHVDFNKEAKQLKKFIENLV